MASPVIQLDDADVRSALARLASAGQNLSPVLQAIGDDVMERAKRRFSTATGPDGTPWRANARSTIEAFIQARGGFGKRGINAKGQALAISKKPLQGQTGDLARQFHVAVAGDSVTVSNSMVYAAMQQFGGKKSQFPNLWGDIPARPFFPITAEEELYPRERESILAQLNDYLAGAIAG